MERILSNHDRAGGETALSGLLFFFCRRIRNFQNISAADIDDFRAAVAQLPHQISIVLLMDVAVEQILRVIPVDECKKSAEPFVGMIGKVAIPADRSVGDDDIHTLSQLPAQPADPAGHLLIAVLVRPVAIAEAAAKTQDAETVERDDFVLDAIAPSGGW